MGPPIRHLTQLLRYTEANTRLLITLSDGKPDDYDGYKGDCGIENTRQALKVIGPFFVPISSEHPLSAEAQDGNFSSGFPKYSLLS